MKMRTTKPEAGNKYYIRKQNGGYSNAILGSPTDKDCNVLANCVGYAYGRFNEIGAYGYCKYLAPVNAENFMDYKGSCKTGMTPKQGACMVWEGAGNLAGHVAIVEKVYDNNHVMTSESGYGSSKPFWNQDRYNNNGRWGCGSNYKFLGFIYNPAVPDEPTPAPTPSDKFNIGDKVVINGALYPSSNAATATGSVNNKITTITRKVDGAAHPYNTEGDLGWMNQSDIKLYEEPKPTPSHKFNIGDRVIINGALYTSSKSDKPAGSISNKVTNITRYVEGAPHPYNTTGDLGWMNESDIKAYSDSITYTVVSGDTLSGIAAKYGMSWQELYAKNKFVIGNNPNIIYPGQVLTIK